MRYLARISKFLKLCSMRQLNADEVGQNQNTVEN